MDKLKQAINDVNVIKGDANFAAKRHKRDKRIERGLDTFDRLIPFTMDFEASDKNIIYLDLNFKPPAPSICCGSCYCSVCEVFANNLTITLTYGYISGTVNIFVGASQETATRVTDFVELDPNAGTLQLNTTGAFIRVCYIYYAGGCNPLDTTETPPTCQYIDTFNRSGGDWGGSWFPTVETGYTRGTDGDAAFMDVPTAGGEIMQMNGPNTIWDDPAGFDLVWVFSTDTLPLSGNSVNFGANFTNSNFSGWLVYVSQDSGEVEVDLSESSLVFDTTNFGYSTGKIFIRWSRVPGGDSKIMVWKDGDSIPLTWLLTTTADSDSLGNLQFGMNSNSSTANPTRMKLWEIGEFCNY